MRTRNATFDELHVVGIGPIAPENSASPRGLSGTKALQARGDGAAQIMDAPWRKGAAVVPALAAAFARDGRDRGSFRYAGRVAGEG
jgi:hypothetical protein